MFLFFKKGKGILGICFLTQYVQGLARAVYSRCETVVLDDVFSGLDTKSITAISSRLLADNGYFREAGKSLILATHTCKSPE